MTLSLHLLCLVSASICTAAINSSNFCKPLPGDIHWPSEAEWQNLNASVSGRLTAPFPYGAVCHPNLTIYNNASCSLLQSQWTNSSWQESNAWTSMYNDETCLPAAEAPCSSQGYPAYIIEATTAADVQAGILFARNTGVRLIVKATSHDVSGRSAGAGALSIWTHLLDGVEINMHEPTAVAAGGVASVKLGAGMVWGDVYKMVARSNITVIGGADPHVGVGGWTSVAGHGPISSLYGLGADQVLEMEVVTADGEYRVINTTSYPDLFWAMRGGGPSSFAIMLSMIVKAYPRLAGYQYYFELNTTANSDTFWNMTAEFVSKLPSLNDDGGMGYFYPTPDTGLANRSTSGVMSGSFLFPSKSAAEVETLTKGLEASFSSPSWAADPIYTAAKTVSFDNFMEFWAATNLPESVGTSTRYVSWLLDAAALQDTTRLGQTFRDITPVGVTTVGHLLAGRGVADARPAGGSNAVLPAWRSAYVHLLQARSWDPLNSTAKNSITTTMREQVQPRLRSLAPNSGSYMSESDPSNPDWQHDYYGSNYDRLLSIKHEWDPTGVFWCKPCVGHEEWDIVPLGRGEEDVYERGIGQDYVQLCRKNVSDG